ncbi:hypothetical protein ACFSQ7_34840 [Paenibacillus rhizoplanae]
MYITFPWYLPDEVSNNMDRYFNEHFKWLADDLEEGHRNSWHSFKYKNFARQDRFAACADGED